MRAFYIVFCLGLIVFGGIKEANAMRCQGKLIMKGDYIYKMFEYCGKPLYSMRDTGIRGDRIIYIYKMNQRTQVVVTRDNVIIDMGSR